MLRFDEDGHVIGFQNGGEAVGDLLGEALLHLQPPREAVEGFFDYAWALVRKQRKWFRRLDLTPKSGI